MLPDIYLRFASAKLFHNSFTKIWVTTNSNNNDEKTMTFNCLLLKTIKNKFAYLEICKSLKYSTILITTTLQIIYFQRYATLLQMALDKKSSEVGKICFFSLLVVEILHIEEISLNKATLCFISIDSLSMIITVTSNMFMSLKICRLYVRM